MLFNLQLTNESVLYDDNDDDDDNKENNVMKTVIKENHRALHDTL